MSHPLVEKILQDGLSSINVSMLSPEAKKKLLTEAATTLMARNRFAEAAQALHIGNNQDQLRETGEWLLSQHRYAVAAQFLRFTGESDRLHRLAQDCISSGDISAAKAIYESLGDTTMIEFLNANFGR